MSSLTRITSDFLRQMKLPHPGEGDKKARGNVLVIAGGAEVPGSALLAGIGALRAGAGRLQIATCARNATALGIAVPEALVLGVPETPAGAIDPIAAVQLMPYVERADVVLLGPGLPDEASIATLAVAMLEKVRPGPRLRFRRRCDQAPTGGSRTSRASSRTHRHHTARG
jgi:NAD(P)H-hydrate repair Nnr-like enzyme with NAD(P)H-hydrate dehydratase domain